MYEVIFDPDTKTLEVRMVLNHHGMGSLDRKDHFFAATQKLKLTLFNVIEYRGYGGGIRFHGTNQAWYETSDHKLDLSHTESAITLSYDTIGHGTVALYAMGFVNLFAVKGKEDDFSQSSKDFRVDSVVAEHSTGSIAVKVISVISEVNVTGQTCNLKNRPFYTNVIV